MERLFQLILLILVVVAGLLLLFLLASVLLLIALLPAIGVLIVVGLFFGLSPQETISHPLFPIGLGLVFTLVGVGWLLTHRSQAGTALQSPLRGLGLLLSSEADGFWMGLAFTTLMGAALVFPGLLPWLNNNFWLYFVCIVLWPLPRKIVLSVVRHFRKPSYQGS